MTQGTNGTIELLDLTKRFGAHTAVDGINMDIPSGEFFSMLGPSGCGKTTTLRMIAGFEQPDTGKIVLDGVDMVHSLPHKRPVNTVFQNYALFPHLNVFDNVAFGLRRGRISKDEVKRRANEALELVMLGDLGDRRPSELSGGQQQRVALARALVLKPAGLLLDEPLGALDAKLRRQLQIELKSLQEQVGITFIYVTHDQDEALTMSDRIAVMNDGHVEQMGPPREIYETPETAFVADFLGASNLMDGVARGSDGSGNCRVDVGGTEFLAALGSSEISGASKVMIRPERVRLGKPGTASDGCNRTSGRIERSIYIGSAFQVVVKLDIGCTIEVEIQNTGEQEMFAVGSEVCAELPPEALRVLRDRPEGRGAPPTARKTDVEHESVAQDDRSPTASVKQARA
ncbi:ABC transporter ATP-binding protein [Halofilum ochraceum]|uniref:ABC transporter ATP-binding protein n=1 Tax=Halofilum ochraceum TaxID=1611323 RepID=UPI0008D95FC9|nr:ABC transporter ATP-binding protein [Halofilum ochraceum]